MKKYQLFTVAVVAGMTLSGCTQVPNYRDKNIESNTPQIENPTPNIEVEPSQDYSEYSEVKELTTINYEAVESDVKTKSGDNITVDYSGFLTDGTYFDSSIVRGTPFEFVLGTGSVIEGWDEGFLDKSIGDKFTLIVPSEKAYGEQERGAIPANSVLVFEVEIKDIASAE